MFNPGDHVRVVIEAEKPEWMLVREADSDTQTLLAVRYDGSELIVEFGQVTSSTSAAWNRLCAGR
jgi:hypothetical protein